jgi:hypothetical protein
MVASVKASRVSEQKASLVMLTVFVPPSPPPGFRPVAFAIVERHQNKTTDIPAAAITSKVFEDAIRAWLGAGVVNSTLYLRAEHFDGTSSVEMATEWNATKREWSPWMSW